MKRALAICAAMLLFGMTSFGYITGTWTGEMNFLPTPEFVGTDLALTYHLGDFSITSNTVFGGDPIVYQSQSFNVSGMIAFVDFSAELVFDPAVPAYRSAMAAVSMDLFGVDIGLRTDHWLYADYIDPTVPFSYPWRAARWWIPNFPIDLTDICADAQTDPDNNYIMWYTLDLGMDPFHMQAIFYDCCLGINFGHFLFSFKDIEFCCGLYYDAEVYFTKQGFQYFKWTMYPMFQYAGQNVGVSIEYGVDYKKVTPIIRAKPTPDLELLLCGELYMDTAPFAFHGFTLSCGDDCNMIYLTTFFDPDEAPAAYGFRSYYVDCDDENDLIGREFERIKLEFCGPGCCGGEYSVQIMFYFWEIEEDFIDIGYETLFALSRIAGTFTIPLMQDLNVFSTFSAGLAGDECDRAVELGFGWEFSF